MAEFKPMLAGKAEVGKTVFPVLASPKLDGIRACVLNGHKQPGYTKGPILLSRALKLIPNRYIRSILEQPEFEGLDGELIVGAVNHPNAMQITSSGVMRIEGTPEFTYHVFDLTGIEHGFQERYEALVQRVMAMHTAWPTPQAHAKRVAQRITDGTPIIECPVKLVPHVEIRNQDDLDQFEADSLAFGYEGVMIRSLDGLYKHGRSTVREGALLKVKRFEDGEAVIIGFEEEMANGNAATRNELGRTKRSTAKAGLTGKATLGAFIVRDVKTGVEFNIGTGMTADERQQFWSDQKQLLGKLVHYRSFPVGVKEKPRHPVFHAIRHVLDMS